ncbi:MAG: nucleoside hydrolase [Sphingobacteriales bacterium]|nr:nucleoside hydrolase [Sphingobacteriales bacterium]
MPKCLCVTLLLCFASIQLFSQSVKSTSKKPVSIIFDTDIGPDYDDVGAIAMLHAFADNNECKILATVASNQHKRIGALLSLFNTYFNRPDVPVGVVRGKAVNLEAVQKWDSIIVDKYPHSIKMNDEAEDAVTLYRRILSKQPDKSVTIVTVGFLTNMANLLKSQPDDYSPLNGKDLIAKKVKHLVSMAGRFNNEMSTFKEFNVERDAAASKNVFDNWNTPIIFTGWEIGSKVFTGIPLIKSDISNSPVKEVFEISIPKDPADKNGRMSWDETAVLIAVRGYDTYYLGIKGRIISNEDGSHGWDPKGKGHVYVKEKMPVKQVEELINTLIMHQPIKR